MSIGFCEVSGADLAVLFQHISSTQEFCLPPVLSGVLLVPDFPQPTVSRPDDMAALVSRQRNPFFARDSFAMYGDLGGDTKTRRGNFEVREQIRSTAALPLQVGEEIVGALFVNFRQPQRFDSAQRELLEGLATYAAIAIRNSGLFTELTRRRIRELELLQEIDAALSQSLELRVILDTLIERACREAGADGGTVFLFDEQQQVLEARAAAGRHKEMRILPQLLNEAKGTVGWAFKHRRSIRVDNARTDPSWKDLYIAVAPETVSELDVLLRRDDEILGVLNLESTREAAFTEEDQAFLETLAGRAVLAIKNAAVFERERRLGQERQALIEIGQEINAQSNSVAVLELILKRALEVTQAAAGNLMLYDPSRSDLWMAAECGVQPTDKGRRQRLDDGVVGWAARHKSSLIVQDVQEAPWNDRYVPFIIGTRSELAVPILEGDQLRGVINLESPEPNQFGESDARLLTALANLAVIALRNTERIERSETSVKRLRALHDVSEEIIYQTDDPDQVMRAILENGMLLTNAETGDLHLYDGDSLDSVYFATRSAVDQERVISRVDSTDLVFDKIERGVVAYVAETKAIYVTQGDAQTVSVFVGDVDVHSQVAVPLLSGGGRFIGVLNLMSTQPYAFQKTDVEDPGVAGRAGSHCHSQRS